MRATLNTPLTVTSNSGAILATLDASTVLAWAAPLIGENLRHRVIYVHDLPVLVVLIDRILSNTELEQFATIALQKNVSQQALESGELTHVGPFTGESVRHLSI